MPSSSGTTGPFSLLLGLQLLVDGARLCPAAKEEAPTNTVVVVAQDRVIDMMLQRNWQRWWSSTRSTYCHVPESLESRSSAIVHAIWSYVPVDPSSIEFNSICSLLYAGIDRETSTISRHSALVHRVPTNPKYSSGSLFSLQFKKKLALTLQKAFLFTWLLFSFNFPSHQDSRSPRPVPHWQLTRSRHFPSPQTAICWRHKNAHRNSSSRP